MSTKVDNHFMCKRWQSYNREKLVILSCMLFMILCCPSIQVWELHKKVHHNFWCYIWYAKQLFWFDNHRFCSVGRCSWVFLPKNWCLHIFHTYCSCHEIVLRCIWVVWYYIWSNRYYICEMQYCVSSHHLDEDADQHGHNQTSQCQDVELVTLNMMEMVVHDLFQSAFNLCDSFF